MIWRAIDLETWLIAPGQLAPRPVSVAWADVQTPEDVTLRLWSDPSLLRELGGVLAGGVIGHNVAYDLAVIVQWYPSLRDLVWRAYREGRVLDTMLACRLADVASDDVQAKYSLADCCKRLLQVDIDGKHGPDAWRLRYRELTDVPIERWPAAAEAYARLDVTYTAKLFNAVGRQATDEFEARAAFALHLSSAWGLRCDAEAVQKLEVELRTEVANRDRVLREFGLLKRDGSKNVKLVEAMVREELGEDAPKTQTGRAKVDAKTLKSCRHPALASLADAAAAAKLQSAFLPVVKIGMKAPIHPKYVTVLRSDRVSCQQPNIQQMPRKGGIRETFVPRPGNVFVSVDYAGAELVCLAQVLLHLFKESAMAKAILDGQDLHIKTGAMLLQRSYEQTLSDYKAREEKAVEARQLAKALNFGLPAGLAPKTLQTYVKNYGIDINLTQATEYRNRWLLLYPEMERYFVMLKQAARHDTFKIVHPLTGFVRGGCDFTSGANHYFQSLLAKIAKQALWDVTIECYNAFDSRSPLAGTRIAAFIHDEILLEASADIAPEAAERLSQLMTNAARVWMPDLPLSTDPTLMTCWSKEAQSMRDENGRLLVWSPDA